MNPAPPPPNTHERLNALIEQIIETPERRAELEAQIEREFTERRAVLVLDMSGFSRTTQVHGVVSFLLMIHQMRRLAQPVVVASGGRLVKAEADNLYCLFETVEGAVTAAREIIRRLETVNILLPAGRRLYASIGIGFGQVLTAGHEDLFGDEVNLASKLGEDVAGEGVVLLTEGARAMLPETAAAAEQRISISGIALRYFALA